VTKKYLRVAMEVSCCARHGSVQPLAVVTAADGDSSRESILTVLNKSPWGRYKKVYNDDLAGPASIVVERSHPSELRIIQTHKAEEQETVLQGFRGLAYRNIISIEQCLRHHDTIYVLHEYLPLSLESLIACPAFLNEIQLVSILGQVTAFDSGLRSI
jgi:hypothetical protein